MRKTASNMRNPRDVNQNLSDKTLLIVLYGEPRGIGNSDECPGTNQLDYILNWPDIQDFESVHVSFSITTERVSNQPWDNSYMVDRNGLRWNAEHFLPESKIRENINKWMQTVDSGLLSLSWDIHIRKPSALRWGIEYHLAITRALQRDNDFFIFHRLDNNVAYEKIEHARGRSFRKFLANSEDVPAVATVTNGHHTMHQHRDSRYEELDVSDGNKVKQGITIFWTNYEMMMWNRPGLEALEKLLHIKAQNERFYHNWESEYTSHSASLPYLSWIQHTRIDSGENFWAVILSSMSALYHNFVVLDVLPFRSLIRDTPEKQKLGGKDLKTVLNEIRSDRDTSMCSGKGDIGLKKDDEITSPPDYIDDSNIQRFHCSDITTEGLPDMIDRLYYDSGIKTYFNPNVSVAQLNYNFNTDNYKDHSRIQLNKILAKPLDTSLEELTSTTHTVKYKIKYGPDEYPPTDGFYYNQFMELIDNDYPLEDRGFQVTIFYSIYMWFNEFDWNFSSWSRPLCLFVGPDRAWRIHPGNARLRFKQFRSTTTPMFMFLHKDIDLSTTFKHTYMQNTELLNSTNFNIEFYNKLQRVSRLPALDIYLRVQSRNSNDTRDRHPTLPTAAGIYGANSWPNGVLPDMWWTYMNPKTKKSFEGETVDTYFGDTLTVKFENRIVYYNDEKVAKLDDDDHLVFFDTCRPKFKI